MTSASSAPEPHEVRVTGREALLLVSELLQRVRRADPVLSVWEAADPQWWWRKPRDSDGIEQLFWVGSDGPVAGVWLTRWETTWQCDPILVPGGALDPAHVWAGALAQVRAHVEGEVEVPVKDDDRVLTALLRDAGLTEGYVDTTGWLPVADRVAVETPATGFTLVDRSDQPSGSPHPMRDRNGAAVQERLLQCPLYDPSLDLAVETDDGEVAGYCLCWFDPVTKVGLVEPVRVEDAHQRRGLARAMLTTGIDRLARRGAERVKVSWGSEGAGALYQGVGFVPESTATWFVGHG